MWCGLIGWLEIDRFNGSSYSLLTWTVAAHLSNCYPTLCLDQYKVGVVGHVCMYDCKYGVVYSGQFYPSG